ncbi:DUF4247 domain-containing protein [Bacillaceae bacterium SIJ1]|uniref:DUF4247 domain-containing protein n=1 Tax=Litoribacterium kuwaitense TaxID=1398745 RepID=UPI0013EA1AEC|nr:DUF4247 domain-containing protein [Litoribacterium kuwaitense]NGP45043.1 DUF4247 domain-containing protein [Litoribacterium kuwaitense]
MRAFLYGSTFVLMLLLLTACGDQSVSNYIEDTDSYELKDVITSSADSSDYSKVYQVNGKSIEQVSDELKNWREPEEESDVVDGRKLMIYGEELVVLSEEDGEAQVEVSEDDFVRDNYSPSFFNQLMTLAIINRFLGIDGWGTVQRDRCRAGDCYGGYTSSGGSYRGPSGPSPFKGYSSRGGGPGVGK